MNNLTITILRTIVALSVCTSVAQSKPRIVGGTQSEVGSFPYFVEMGGCGGALIGPDVVLFAAHCGSLENQEINIGAYERRTATKLKNASQSRFCEEYKAHPNYGTGGSSINNDFALCKLDKPVNIDTSFVQLELDEGDVSLQSGDSLIVMGLGALNEGVSGPEFLHDVTVPFVSNDDCNAESSYKGGVTDQMLCAGFPEGQKDACQGDSGGPLVKRIVQSNGTFKDYHVGVVSWGHGCAQANKPGVYARTSSGIDFIKNTACNDFKSTANFCHNSKSLPSPHCDVELKIRLQTDVYGFETSWTITNDRRQEVKARKYLLKFHAHEHSVCLEKGTCYTFEISDDYGDGMCTTDNGCGDYELSVNGQTIHEGDGKFEKKETKDFCIDRNGNAVEAGDPTPAPVTPVTPVTPVIAPSPNGNCGGKRNKQFEVQLKIDDFGGETGWILSKINPNEFDPETFHTGIFVAESDPAGFEAFDIVTFPRDDSFYCLEQNACYLFEVFDEYGDGLVGGASKGFYKGFLGGKLVFQGADFEYYEWKTFCTGNAEIITGDPPTLSPTNHGDDCVDRKGKIKVGNKKRKCSWAANGSMKKRVKKCQKTVKGGKKFHDLCPKTCGKKAGIGKCKHLQR